ncbi:MAG: adenylate/guanylate cyclase domain-containing protein [Bacteroidetes bacterium]|nr:adenylate/guanylate cyclase domain-containing protein [Bacteroidota bacterium]MBS1932773.1 adenylate/guanylate cyclase domain-containing protein [Bacteroidota bacterium]
MEQSAVLEKNNNGKMLFRKLLKFILKAWEKVVTAGIYDGLSDWEKKRTRLVNGISFFTVLIFISFVLSYLDKAHRTTFYESLTSAIFYSLPIILNYFRKYTFAVFLFNIYSTAIYTFYAISHGKVDASEYLLFSASVAAMLFFRNFVVILLFFLLNLGCFWLCKYSFIAMKPFLFMPAGENMYVANHIFTFITLFMLVYYFKSENLRQEKLLKLQNENLETEKQKSDNLLLNILPSKTAEELKETGKARARQYEMVTVMFTDFVNFTKVATLLSPEELVMLINSYFSDFDEIISKYQVEKIKTIGDSYMCAGGLPETASNHASETIKAALEIQLYMNNINKKKQLLGEPYFEARVGIHSGPVVAGIAGTKKFAYDIWGDTVNTASRLESCGEPSRVNISGETYRLVHDKFHCVYRGKIAAKNKGEIDMYFVEGENKN